MSTATIVPSICVTQKIESKIHQNISFNQTHLPDGSIRIDLQPNTDKTLADVGLAELGSKPLAHGFPEGRSVLGGWMKRNNIPQPLTMGSTIDTHSDIDMVRGLTFTGSHLSPLVDYEWEADLMFVTDPFFPKNPPNPTQSTSSLCVPSFESFERITQNSTWTGSSDLAKGN